MALRIFFRKCFVPDEAEADTVLCRVRRGNGFHQAFELFFVSRTVQLPPEPSPAQQLTDSVHSRRDDLQFLIHLEDCPRFDSAELFESPRELHRLFPVGLEHGQTI